MQRISGYRFTLNDNPSETLTRLTRRRAVWTEIQSEHLNTRGLSKCHPITGKPLTIRGSCKHPSTLTNFLLEEHSIHTRDIYQEIGSGLMTNTNKVLGGWEG